MRKYSISNYVKFEYYEDELHLDEGDPEAVINSVFWSILKRYPEENAIVSFKNMMEKGITGRDVLLIVMKSEEASNIGVVVRGVENNVFKRPWTNRRHFPAKLFLECASSEFQEFLFRTLLKRSLAPHERMPDSAFESEEIRISYLLTRALSEGRNLDVRLTDLDEIGIELDFSELDRIYAVYGWESGVLPPGTVVPTSKLVFEDDEVRTLFASYRAILGRVPDPAGLSHFVSLKRNSRMSERELVAHLASSEEARVKGVLVIDDIGA